MVARMLLITIGSVALLSSVQTPCPDPLPNRPIPFCRLSDSSRRLIPLSALRYPPVLEQAGIGGKVEIEVIIDTAGRVDSCRCLASGRVARASSVSRSALRDPA